MGILNEKRKIRRIEKFNVNVDIHHINKQITNIH